MTPEEQERYERIERLMEFLANNQAQLSAQQAQFSAQEAQFSARQAQFSEDLEKLKEITGTHTSQIVQLADTVLSLVRIVEEQGRRTEERFREVAAAQVRTDDRLNTLIGVVERFFSDGKK
ncbi:MAG: hypothetical protein HY646_06735 [Acidobacteria bacterium]|nr:hypothetical protein [Acidobacteriota bacterium]